MTADAVPTMPMPTVGAATLGGHVRDADGRVVVGATVQVAERDVTAVTDSDGAYRLEVPSDSTVTLSASAMGLALTFRESVVLAEGASIGDFDLILLRPERVTAIDALGAPGQEAARGLMAVRLHSLDPACALPGARVSVWPSGAGKVLYGGAGAPGTMPAPDPTLTSVQDGAEVAAWLAGVFPPANNLYFAVEQPGCRLAADSPSMGGLTYAGQRHVVPMSMTLVDLFLEVAP